MCLAVEMQSNDTQLHTDVPPYAALLQDLAAIQEQQTALLAQRAKITDLPPPPGVDHKLSLTSGRVEPGQQHASMSAKETVDYMQQGGAPLSPLLKMLRSRLPQLATPDRW